MAKRLKDEDLILNVIINGDRGRKEMARIQRTVKDTEKELRALERTEKKLRAQGKANTEEFKNLRAAIKQKKQAVELANARLDELRQGLDLTKMSTVDLRKEMSRLRRLRDMSTPHTKQWREFDMQLQKVRKRYDQVNGASKATGLSLKRMANTFNHYFGLIAAGAATVVGAITGIRRSIEEFAEFADRLSDVEKTSGLSSTAVRELSDELEKIDTRTAMDKLNGLARIGGKLGQDTKEDIEGFVRATDQLVVALSEDLGGDVEETVTVVGKMVDVFDLEREFGIEKSLLKIGSLINSIGAASTANEGKLVDFLSRSSGLAKNFGITISDMAGLGSVADQLNLSMETAATTFNQVVPNMLSNAQTFARIAGMEYQEFSELLETDVNEAFLRVLEGTKSSSDSNQEFIKILGQLGLEGGRVRNVIGALAANTTKIRKEQIFANKAFQEGTSITEEFNIKNTNAAARLEKARNKAANMRRELGEKLFPVMTISTNAMSYFLKILKGLIEFMEKYGRSIAVVTAVILTYNVGLKLVNLNLAQSAILIKARIFLDKAMRASTMLAAAAQALFRGKTMRAVAAMRVFNSVVKANPIVLLISVLAAAGLALSLYSKKMSAAVLAQKSLIDVESEAQKSIIDKRAELDRLLAVVKDETIAEGDRAKALERIKELNPEILSGLTQEAIKTGEAKAALDEYIRSLLKKARVEAAQAKLKKLAEAEIDLQTKGEGLDPSFGSKLKTNFVLAAKMQFGIDLGADDVVQAEATKAYQNAQAKIEAERKALLELIKDNQSVQDILDELVTGTGTGNAGGLSEEEIATRYNARLRAIRAGEMKVTEELRSQFIQRKIDQQEFDESIKKAQLARLLAQKAALEEAGRDTLSIQQQINDLEFTIITNRINREKEEKELKAEWEQNLNDRIISDIDERVAAELEAHEKLIEAEDLALQKTLEAEKAKEEARKKAMEAALLAAAQTSEAALAEAQTVEEAGYVIINTVLSIIEAYIAQTVAAAIKKTFEKSNPLLGLILAPIAVGAIKALFRSVLPKIELPSRESPGAETGGYYQDVVRSQDGRRFRARNRPAARGFLREPTLLVSENGDEFVANNQAVNNPTIRPFLDVLDVAQRNGSISTLNLNKVLQEGVIARGFSAGGFVGSSVTSSSNQPSESNLNYARLEELLKLNMSIQQTLLQKLQQPVKAYVVHREIRAKDDEYLKAKGPSI